MIDHWRPRIDLALTSKSQQRQKLFFELFKVQVQNQPTRPTYYSRPILLDLNTGQSLCTIVTVTIKLGYETIVVLG